MATGLAFDRVGRGSTVWTAGPQTAGYQGRLRLIADQGPTVRDDSDEPFLVTNGGNHFYVNDSSATGDVFTTAVGNNANTGKSPSQPMATLAALLDAYDLDPGDIVHVDTGHYDLLRTLVLGNQDSGLRIEGPPTAGAVLDRGNWDAILIVGRGPLHLRRRTPERRRRDTRSPASDGLPVRSLRRTGLGQRPPDGVELCDLGQYPGRPGAVRVERLCRDPRQHLLRRSRRQ